MAEKIIQVYFILKLWINLSQLDKDDYIHHIFEKRKFGQSFKCCISLKLSNFDDDSFEMSWSINWKKEKNWIWEIWRKTTLIVGVWDWINNWHWKKYIWLIFNRIYRIIKIINNLTMKFDFQKLLPIWEIITWSFNYSSSIRL
jgi:hypothetical protein